MNLAPTAEILDAAGHLPSGAALVVPQVDWEDYERLLEAFAERPGLRLSYDCGRLEIVSPSPEHGEYERLIEDLVTSACEVFRVKIEKRGTATWKRRSKSKGVEGDASYYIQNAERIIGRRTIDLESDPPPDIVLEIDLTNPSLKKFPIYAALGVPEIWRYDGRICRFYALEEGKYVETGISRFIPGLTGAILSESVELSKTQGQDAARTAFRRRLRRQRKER